MDTAVGRRVSVLRALAAVLLALVIGAGSPALGLFVFVESTSMWGLAGVAIAWAAGALASVVVHDFVLRRGGAELPPLRTPRNLFGVAAWGAGVVLGLGPVIVLFLLLVLNAQSVLNARSPSPGTEALLGIVAMAAALAALASPTLGMLITRALCRRWAAPPAASPPAPAAAPVPLPLPARPADDPPVMPYLPSPA